MKLRITNRELRMGLAVMAAGIMIASCAKREAEGITQLEQKSLDAWVAKHVNGQGIKAVRQSNGMWVEFIEEGDPNGVSGVDTVVWAQLNYTFTDIAGNVFATRDSIEALRQRSFTPHTYYVPEYASYGVTNPGWPEGQFFAMKNELTKPDGSKVKLTEGSRVKLYLPSRLAYRSKMYVNDQGYGGQYSLEASKIVIQDITVKGIVKNPLRDEESRVEKLALEQWQLDKKDTIALGLYVDTINFRPRADLLAKFPNKEFESRDSLGLDSTAAIWFIGRFLPTPEYPDGFIFDTNIPTVYEEFYNRRKSQNYVAEIRNLSVLSYKPSKDKGELPAAFYRAIPQLRRGQWSRIVFPSAYGWGPAGFSKALLDKQAASSSSMNMMMEYYAYSSMLGYGGGGYYGGGYGGYGSFGGYDPYYGGGYDPYYDPYYNSFYSHSPSMFSNTESELGIVTEIQPYTPLIFEIYIEAND